MASTAIQAPPADRTLKVRHRLVTARSARVMAKKLTTANRYPPLFTPTHAQKREQEREGEWDRRHLGGEMVPQRYETWWGRTGFVVQKLSQALQSHQVRRSPLHKNGLTSLTDRKCLKTSLVALQTLFSQNSIPTPQGKKDTTW